VSVGGERHLFTYDGGRWVRSTLTGVVAATYAQ